MTAQDTSARFARLAVTVECLQDAYEAVDAAAAVMRAELADH